MRLNGLRLAALAMGLAVAGTGQGVAQTPVSAGAPTAAKAQAFQAKQATAPTTPAKQAAPGASVQSSDPLLAQDGAPAMAVDPVIGHPNADWIDLQPQVTKNGKFAHWMHNAVLVPVITLISLLVLFLLFWVVFRYRRAANETPSKTSHNTVVEVIWTLAPVVILVLIAIPSIGLLQAQFKPAPKNAVTLKAIGNQWYWGYEYPDHGVQLTANLLKEPGQSNLAPGERTRTDADGPRLLATDTRVVLPVGVPIRLLTTGQDVIHSWAVPAFWIKLDAVPGRINETSFTIEKPGLYFGQCSELCGARHAYMPIAVEAVPPAQFAAWVKAKGGSMPGASKSAQPVPAATAGSTPASASVVATDANPKPTAEGAPVSAPAAVLTRPATANGAGLGNAGH